MIKKKKPTGRSFPFIERKDGSLKLKYDGKDYNVC